MKNNCGSFCLSKIVTSRKDMSQATTSSSAVVGDGANNELGATLLLSNSKYHRMWRRTLYIGFLISIKKSTTSSGDDDEFSYTSLPPARTYSFESYVAIDIGEEKDRIRSDIARIAKDKDLKSLHELGGVDFVSTILAGQRPHSEPKEGIIDDEKTVLPSLVLGANFSSFLLKSCKCHRCTILMLLISAGLPFAIEFKQEGLNHGWHDDVPIVFVVFLLVAGNSIANFWRERKKLKLLKRKHELQFKVKSGEESLMVPISDILVGDTVWFKGDWGQRRIVVVSVGNKANLAEIDTCVEKSGLLESLIEKPISYIYKAALFISVLVALVVLITLIGGKHGNNSGLPEMNGKVSISLLMEALESFFEATRKVLVYM